MKIFFLKLLGFLFLITMALLLFYYFLDKGDESIGEVRYAKTRRIYREKNSYDALLIGSSRILSVKDVEIDGIRIFNYGFHAGKPSEYPGFISFGIKNQPIKKVIAALDFYGSSKKGRDILAGGAIIKEPEEYINDVTTEINSLTFFTKFRFIRFKRVINQMIIESSTKASHTWNKRYWELYQGVYSNYERDGELEETYDKIKKVCGDAELIVWITPISEPLFELMQEKNLEKDYENFLRTCVASFGSVYNFMEINEFTKSPQYFVDDNHPTKEHLYKMVESIVSGKVKDGMVTRLDSINIDDYIINKRYKKDIASPPFIVQNDTGETGR